MDTDWNWFFSSFAQSGAALIGIIAAFIISKLLSESEKTDQIHDSLEKLILSYNDLVKRINGRYFDWYNEKTIEYSFKLRRSINNGDFDGLSDINILDKLYKIEPSLFKDDRNLEYFISRKAKLKPEPKRQMGTVGITASIQPPLLSDLPPDGLLGDLEREREMLSSLKIESENSIDKFNILRVGLVATGKKLYPIKISIYLLSMGFLFSVIYPLHFLPMRINHDPHISFSINVIIKFLLSIKGLLLAILTFVIEGIFVYFLFLVHNINKKYLELSGRIKREYTEITGYSRYFI